ncbi:hypothetical protein MMC25_006926 [Agyrium rufum]|nr:hypothetical protein [Agyrium rufum]
MVFPDSVILANIEYQCWQSRKDQRALEQVLLSMLELRKSAFGKQSPSVIQNLANLSQVRISYGLYSTALEAMFEGWSSATTIYGDSGAKQDLRTPRDAESVFNFLWEMTRLDLGETDAKTLQYGQDLAHVYLQLRRLDQAAATFRSLYQASLASFGDANERTGALATTLIDVLERMSGHEDEIRRLHEAASDTSKGDLPLWHADRVRGILSLVSYYVKRKLLPQAEAKLRQYLGQLKKFPTDDGDETFVFIAISDVTLRPGQLLSSMGRPKAATEVFTAYWMQYEQDTSYNGLLHADSSALSKFRIVAEELIILGAFGDANDILTRLRAWHLESSDTMTSDEALLVALALARCCHLSPGSDDTEDPLRYLYETLFGEDDHSHQLDTNELTVCINLATLYNSFGRVNDAIDVCLQALRSGPRFWTSHSSVSARQEACLSRQ